MRIPLIAVFLPALLLAGAPAMAEPRDDAMAGISRCSAIADNRNFLNCIYGAVQPLRAQLQLPPAPEAQTRLVPPALASAPPPRPPARSRIPSESEFAGGMRERMDNFSFDRRGLFNLMLENGEMYKQEAGDAPRAKWLGRGSDYVVYVIKDGAGGAVMKVTGDPNIYRMRKIN